MYNDFNSRFEKSRKRNNVIFKIAAVSIGIIFLIIVVGYALMGTLLYQSVTDPSSIGTWIGKFIGGIKEQIK